MIPPSFWIAHFLTLHPFHSSFLYSPTPTPNLSRGWTSHQITTLVTFVSASFVLLWMPAWTYYLICFYAPHVLASRNVRSLFAIGCRVYLLNFVINAILFYRYNPRYREAACSCFRGCFREAESASSPTAKTCQIHVTAASEERIP